MDRLMTVDGKRFTDYLRQVVYPKMAKHTRSSDHVMEICTRHDRGVISLSIVPHAEWTNIDRDGCRPGLTLDVLEDEIPRCDVVISTAILHHTEKALLPDLMRVLCESASRAVILSGPNAEYVPNLIGDHEYHIDGGEICGLAHDNGFHLKASERIGLSDPLCGILLVFERDS